MIENITAVVLRGGGERNKLGGVPKPKLLNCDAGIQILR